MWPGLLPWKAKWAGAALLALGLTLAGARFGLGIRPSWLELPTFAVYSAYFQVTAFSPLTKNLTDELVVALTLGGLWVVALSAKTCSMIG